MRRKKERDNKRKERVGAIRKYKTGIKNRMKTKSSFGAWNSERRWKKMKEDKKLKRKLEKGQEADRSEKQRRKWGKKRKKKGRES